MKSMHRQGRYSASSSDFDQDQIMSKTMLTGNYTNLFASAGLSYTF